MIAAILGLMPALDRRLSIAIKLLIFPCFTVAPASSG
jgi:hypothetical protein